MVTFSDLPTNIIASPITPSSVLLSQPATHLDHLGIADGETMHSFCRSCSITLSMLGASIEDIATHVGWRSTKSARYYTQTDKVLGLTN